ncbi:malonyl-ACP O-methyltransferase BioC [Flammeovirga sp. SJP92]|uniref:malonyl-ACP O-methyltransferase BioC n=1 Tax=Flammeovirga sp. SJP92 TaxID=1775430 RepID=UPI000793B30E|nr:malonyl-ACP O-methyltransferase BioC [Flammeovirga sp. SJP92]KXX69705.1 hypothetical protein AVL50_12485 [Flammeovirga sp. SJP92]
MITVDKQKVASRFGKNVGTYDKEAFIQKEITNELYKEIVKRETHFHKAFEIGCGSGFLTKQIEKNISGDYIVNDLDPLCTHQLLREFPRLQFKVGDIENIPLPQHLDLVISTSVLQWMEDIDALLKRIYNALEPEGHFAFSTFGPSNFLEIKALLNQGLEYLSMEEWKFLLQKNGFQLLDAWEWKEECLFDSGTAVLKHMKNTGVNGTAKNQKVWNARILQRFNTEYQDHFSKNDKVTLTYHPLFFILKK